MTRSGVASIALAEELIDLVISSACMVVGGSLDIVWWSSVVVVRPTGAGRVGFG